MQIYSIIFLSMIKLE